MSIAQVYLAEFEIQAPITRRFLERLPEDKLRWQPHPRSLSAGQLAFHIASVPGGLARFVQRLWAPVPEFNFHEPGSVAEILKAHDDGAATVREVLPQFTDADMAYVWRMMAGVQEVFAQPRGLFLRDVMLNHWYQHRGQFAVYLRLLDVPVPSSWGPSADEVPANMQLQMA